MKTMGFYMSGIMITMVGAEYFVFKALDCFDVHVEFKAQVQASTKSRKPPSIHHKYHFEVCLKDRLLYSL